MKGFLLCCLWVIFEIQATAQTDSTVQKDTTTPVIVQNPYATKLIPFNSHTFLNTKLTSNQNNFSILNNRIPVTYQLYGKTPFQTIMEVTGTVLSVIANPRTSPYIPPPNKR